MPFLPIHETFVNIGGVGGLPLPAPGDASAGFWPLSLTSERPRVVERWDIYSLYLPVAVQVVAGPGTPPTVCHLTVQALMSGELVFQQSLDVSLITPTGGDSVGQSRGVSSSFSTPVAWRAGQTFAIGFISQFDQALPNGAHMYLGAQLLNTSSGQLADAPGSIGYAIVVEHELVSL